MLRQKLGNFQKNLFRLTLLFLLSICCLPALAIAQPNSCGPQNQGLPGCPAQNANNSPSSLSDSCDPAKHQLATLQKQSCACTDNTDASYTQKQVKSCNNCRAGYSQGCIANNVIVQDIQTIVNLLSAIVGVIVIGNIIVGGIQYTIAGDNAQQLTGAKKRILNGLVALAGFLFIFAFLQWLIPGGVFK